MVSVQQTTLGRTKGRDSRRRCSNSLPALRLQTSQMSWRGLIIWRARVSVRAFCGQTERTERSHVWLPQLQEHVTKFEVL